jgi:SMODS-associating 2TM, beta-strand rich effector domain
MHEYSINLQERLYIPFFLAGASMLLVLLLKQIPGMPEWVPIPSAFALYGIFYKLFDRFWWKWKWLTAVGIIQTPNLNGNWLMETTSSKSNYEITYKGRLRIEQTWTRVSLFFEGSNATSTSEMAAISIRNHSFFTVRWEYLSRKKPEFSDEDYMHYGITRLQWTGSDAMDSLEGDYYTDRSRHQYGQVTIKKA